MSEDELEAAGVPKEQWYPKRHSKSQKVAAALPPQAALPSQAVAVAEHPDNVPAEKPEKRGVRIGRLSETLQERLLIKLLDEKLSAAASQAMVDILEGGEDRARVELLKEILKYTPVPVAAERAVSQQVVAIQIGGGMRRGAKEFA